MTKFMNATKSKAIGLVISAQLVEQELKNRLKQTITSKNGDVFGQHGLIIVIAVVIAGVAMAFLIPYFKDDIGGGLKDKTTEFFNMK